ncbi:MAG TPA: hypothetical protein VD862_04690 [Candidatus Paceibacterota bacterium]|nr:hypothetical protein [Candidatus Paceibacterota bacterium]
MEYGTFTPLHRDWRRSPTEGRAKVLTGNFPWHGKARPMPAPTWSDRAETVLDTICERVPSGAVLAITILATIAAIWVLSGWAAGNF